MKKVFKFALVAFMAAAVAVSCKDDPQPTPGPGPEPEPEYTGPEQGTSAWSVIGTVLETSWDTDYVLAEADGIFVLKNLKLAAGNEFKIRENKDWTNNRGGDFAELGAGFEVTNGGANIKPELDGIYDVYYNPSLEQMAVCEKDAAPAWAEPSFVPAIEIDADFADWADIEGIAGPDSNTRIREWKYTSDEKYLYFLYKIDKTKIKGSSETLDWDPYIYIGLDTDNNEGTGAGGGGGTMNGCEAQVCIFPWRGTKEAPECVIGEEGNGWIKCPISGESVASPYVAGKIDGDWCFEEVRIPREAIGATAAGKIAVDASMSWYVLGRTEITLN